MGNKSKKAAEKEAVEENNQVKDKAEVQVEEQAEETIELSKEEELEIQVKEMHDKYLRLYSEFENFRKRTIKERADLTKVASASVMEVMLPVLDDFERAITNMDQAKDVNAVKEGVNLIHEKMVRELGNKGLKRINPVGETFDAELHEAITQIPAPSDDMKGKIVDVIENGYNLHDKVVRFAKVVVGN